ncbi:MAG: Gfo/Idh/MocA family protein [Lentisphaeria bacterium]
MQTEAISNPELARLNQEYAKNHLQQYNMAGFRAPKINTVRVGVIGLSRGANHLKALVQIGNVEIRALCDKKPEHIKRGLAWTQSAGHTPEIYTGGEDEWKKLCEQQDLDLVYVCSPIPLHSQISIYAMRQGKHVACEVPAAWEMDDCWQLVKTAEETRKHFMMLENYSYLDFHLQTIMMAKSRFFGDIVHCEGAYNTSKVINCLGSKEKGTFGTGSYTDWWWLKAYAERRGNIYPTHGLGPVAQVLDINRGDRLDYLTSMESNDFNFGPRARELAKEAPEIYGPLAELDYRGNMNTTLIRTMKGRTIVLQHDAHTPQPHNLIHGIFGTEGCALYDPPPPRISTGGHWVSDEECAEIRERFTPEITRKLASGSNRHGHGGSDYRMNWHLIDCLRNGLPMPQDVYDAAAWSAIVPLSQWSVLNRSNPIDIPDFTAGAWGNNPRNMDINLENGGGNTEILPSVKPTLEFDDKYARQWAQDHG